MFKSNRLGLIGIAIAMVGICIAVFQDDLRAEFAPAAPQLAERVAKKGFNLFGKIKVEEETHDRIDYIYISLGLVAFGLGVASYITKENQRISAIASALGIVALAWQYVLIGLVIAVVGFFLACFS